MTSLLCKGLQGSLLSTQTGWIHLSTGDLCREEQRTNSDLGGEIAFYQNVGLLVPDKVVLLLARTQLGVYQDQGFILDGFPRTVSQVGGLVSLLEETNSQIKGILDLSVTDTELLSRAKERAKVSRRLDDQDPAIHQTRIDLFRSETVPAIEDLKKRGYPYYRIDGEGDIMSTHNRIVHALKVIL